MKKNYVIIENNIITGQAGDVELDPSFAQSQLDLGIEYREIPLAILAEDYPHLELVLGVVSVNTVKRSEVLAKEQGKTDRKARLDALDLSLPLGNLDQAVRDLVAELRG